MTTDRSSMHDDQWVDDFARDERRRTYLLGLAILLAAALTAALVLLFFTDTAPMTWM